MTHTVPLYVGVDVGQARLDVAVGKVGETWEATNDVAGIRPPSPGLSNASQA